MWETTSERSRVNYFPGRLLTASDLAAEQAQARERHWLHNRALHGDGIAAGLEVTVEWNTVHVSPGVAIDVLGREIVLTAPRSVDARSVVRESHGRVQVIIAWAEEPADEVVGLTGPCRGASSSGRTSCSPSTPSGRRTSTPSRCTALPAR